MTSARRRRKSWLGLRRLFGTILLLGLAAFLSPPIVAATTERVVSDRHTGLAIDGVDPVAYFTDAEPVFGLPEFEYRHEGVIWRFRNEGNRVAFARNPEIYMPQYGGYDPIAIGRGVAVPGNPLVWVVARQRLYLFFSEVARTQFVTDVDKMVAAAEAKWPTVLAALVQR